MRVELLFDLEKPSLPADNRAIFVSFLKKTLEQPHEQSQADRERIRKASFLAGCVREISERNPVNRLCVSRKITGNTSGSGIGNGTAPILANVHHRAFKRDGVQSIQIE